MAWSSSSGRDLSHYNAIGNYDAARGGTDWVHIKVTESTGYADPMAVQHYRGFGGIPRGAYHFARPVNLADQVRWFLRRKSDIGGWERPDMLDCEFAGVTGTFIRDLVAEYRQQSGIELVLVYCGLHELTTTCSPSLWYDANTPIWAARYRKVGPPSSPDTWAQHLGWDHPGLTTYQWDNATPLAGAGPTDISYERVALALKEDSQVKNLILARELNGTKVWVGDGITRRHVEDPRELEGLQFWIAQKGGDAKLYDFDDLRVLGVDLPGTVGALTDDEAKVIEAIRGIANVDESALATALAPILAPLIQAGATPEQMEAAVRKVFASAGQNPA